MADYVVRVEAATDKAERDLRRVEKQIGNIDRQVKVDIQLPTIGQTVNAVQQFTDVLGKAALTALDFSRKLNVGPGAVLNDLEELFGKVTKAGQKTVSMLELISRASPTNILGTAFTTASDGALKLSRNISAVGFEIFGLTQSVKLLQSTFGGFFNETIGREIRLQEALLRTKTTLISTADVISNGQRLTDPYKALMALDKPIEETLQSIRRRSLDIAGTTSDAIVQVFGVVAAQVGAIGGSIKDAEDLAMTFAAALGTIGMSDPMLANQEIRSILTGNIDQNSVLARSLGITNEEIQKAKSSTEGLVKYLTKRLEGFTAGQKIAAQGFAGITSNIAEVREEALRSFGAPILKPLLDGLTVVYERLTAVFNEILRISSAAGQAVANVSRVFLQAGAQAPSLQGFGGNQAAFFRETQAQAERFAQYTRAELDKIRPVLSRLISEAVKGIARVAQGLGALLKGFAYFKFEQLKVLASSFANIAELLNNSVVPALQAVLNLYGEFLRLPIVNYLSQVIATHKILEAIGVQSVVRLLATWRFFQESINTALGWIKQFVEFVKNTATGVLNGLANVVQGIGNSAATVFNNVYQFGITVLQRLLDVTAGLLGKLSAALRALSQQVAQLGPQFSGLAEGIQNVARSVTKLGLEALLATGKLELARSEGVEAFNKIKDGANNAANKVRSLGSIIGTALVANIKKLGVAVKGLLTSFVGFQIQLLAFQALTAVLTETFGRFQRAQEEATASEATAAALRRLRNNYKDLGEDISEATKRAKEFDEQLVESRYAANAEAIEKLKKEISELEKQLATPGIQSWAEYWNYTLTGLEQTATGFIAVGAGIGAVFKEIGEFAKFAADSVKDLLDSMSRILKLGPLLPDLGTKANDPNAPNFGPGSEVVLEFYDKKRRERLNEFKSKLANTEAENKEITDFLDAQAQAAQVQLAKRARKEAAKELVEYERQLWNELFAKQNEIRRQEIDIARQAGELRIKLAEQANKKALEGVEGNAAAALNALQNYLSTKERGELELQTAEKQMAIQLAELERNVVNYRYEMEKKILQIRQKAAMGDAGGAGGGQYTGPLAGSTGRSTGPHLDIRSTDRNAVINEALMQIQDLQRRNVEYIQLSNIKVDVKDVLDPEELKKLIVREMQVHGRRTDEGMYAVDIAVPDRTPINANLGTPSWDSNGGGWVQTKLGTGSGAPIRYLHMHDDSRASTAAGGPGTTSGNVAGYLRRISFLESEIKNVPNSKGSGAKGYFQTKDPFESEAIAASGGKSTRSADYATSAAAVWAWIKKHRPQAAALIEAGKFAEADKILNRTWAALPGTAQSRPAGVQKEAMKYLTGGGAMPGGASPEGDGDFSLINQYGAGITNSMQQLGALMQRSLDIRKKLQDVTNTEQLDAIGKQLFPKVQLQQYEDELIRLKETLKATAEFSGQVYDPEALKFEIDAKTKLAIMDRDKLAFLEKAKTLKTADGEVIKAEELKKIEENINKVYADRKKELQTELEQRRKILQTTREVSFLEGGSERLRGIQQGLEDAALQNRFDRARALAGNDPYAQRRLEAQYQNELARREQERIANGAPLSAEITRQLELEAQARLKSAESLARMDEEMRRFTERLALAVEATRAITDSFKQGIKDALFNSSDFSKIGENMGRAINERLVDTLLNYAFKPLEDRLMQIFKDALGLQQEVSPEVVATNENTLALKALTAAITTTTTTGDIGSYGLPGSSLSSEALDVAKGLPDLSEAFASAGTSNITELAFSIDSLTASAEKAPAAAQAAAGATQNFVGSLATAAASVMTIFGGIQQIGKGGTYNILSGLGSAFMGVGSLFMGGLKFFAKGGYANPNEPIVVGDGGEPELFIPRTGGDIVPFSKMANYLAMLGAGPTLAQTFGASRAALGGKMGGNYPASLFDQNSASLMSSSQALRERYTERLLTSGGGSTEIKYSRVSANDLPFVTEEQMLEISRASAKEGARLGEARVLSLLKSNPTTRRSLGI